jgi:succinoglycan biosynthesis protein ExoO
VRLLALPRNGGPAAARNAGLAAARGEWIAVLDSDDWMAPDRLERLIAYARAEGADIVADDMLIVPDLAAAASGKRFLGEKRGRAAIDLAAFARDNQLFKGQRQSGYLKPAFRAGFLKDHALRYDSSVRIGEDFVIVAEALAAGARYAFLPEPLYHYVVRPGSISRVLRREDVDSLLAADDRLLSAYGATLAGAARAALAARRGSLQDAAAYIGMLDLLKARRFGAALRLAAARPAAVRHFWMPIAVRLQRLFAGKGAGCVVPA